MWEVAEVTFCPACKRGRPPSDLQLAQEGKWEGLALVSSLISDKAAGNSMRPCQGRFRLGIRKSFLKQRMTGHWNSLPREEIIAPRLPEFGQCSQAPDVILGVLGMAWSWTQ